MQMQIRKVGEVKDNTRSLKNHVCRVGVSDADVREWLLSACEINCLVDFGNRAGKRVVDARQS